MNRRGFLKFLGIGAATAAVAPAILAEKTPEVYPESNGGQITFKMLQDAYAQTVQPTKILMPGGRYTYVYLAPTSLPVNTGDIVYFKADKRYACLAYKAKKWRDGVNWGYGIGNLTPGHYGFIQIPMMGNI